MPEFAYIARDQTGQRITGRLSANNRHEVLAQLDKQSLFPLNVDAAAAPHAGRRVRRVKGELMANTYAQLAALLRSGVPLLRSLKVLRDQTSHAGLAEILSQVHDQVEGGSTLAEALSRHDRVFGEMAVSMVRAGGEGGFMEEALERVADFTERQQDLKSRTLGAIAYPVFLAVFGTIVVFLLLILVVPKFEEIFGRLRARGELPGITEALLAFSKLLQGWWLPILGIMIIAGFWARARLSTESGRRWRDRLKLKLPMAGEILRNMAVARFCRVLGTMLRNGVPILRALEISSSATGNRVLEGAIDDAATNISEGQSLAQPLTECGYFPKHVTEMISVAEESNSLDTVLVQIADSLERRTWRQLDLMVRLLEPIMLLLLAAMVLTVAVALLLPVMKMSSAL